MSLHATNQQAVRDAVAAAVREATDALETRITALEEQLLAVVQPGPAQDTVADPEPTAKMARKTRGTTAGAQTAAASGTSN